MFPASASSGEGEHRRGQRTTAGAGWPSVKEVKKQAQEPKVTVGLSKFPGVYNKNIYYSNEFAIII